MAETPSKMLPLGTKASNFELKDAVSGNTYSLNDLKSDKGTVIAFICNHCPYVKHINKDMAEFAREYQEKGMSFIAISSNDVKNYPQDSPEKMKQLAESVPYNFPYLYDETQDVAKAYQAACTPDFYLFDANMELVYRGRFDEATPGNCKPITGNDLKNAADNLLEGKPIDDKQYPSIGCNIKWK